MYRTKLQEKYSRKIFRKNLQEKALRKIFRNNLQESQSPQSWVLLDNLEEMSVIWNVAYCALLKGAKETDHKL